MLADKGPRRCSAGATGGSGTDRSPGREDAAPAKGETGSSCRQTRHGSAEPRRGQRPLPTQEEGRRGRLSGGAVTAARCPSKQETTREEQEGCSEDVGDPNLPSSQCPPGLLVPRYHFSHPSWTRLRLEGEEDVLLTRSWNFCKMRSPRAQRISLWEESSPSIMELAPHQACSQPITLTAPPLADSEPHLGGQGKGRATA